MNEPADARALRVDIPLRADVPLPDSDRLAPQRALLAEAFRQEAVGAERPAPVPLPRRRFVLMTAAAATGLVVTGGIVAALSDDDAAGTARATTTTPAGRRLLSAQASADTLELAAATVEKLGTTEPGPKQWVYEKSTSFDQGKPQSSEQWTRWDGTGAAQLPGVPGAGDMSNFDPDRLQVRYFPNQEEKWKREGYDDRSQRQFYRFLATLPSDPDRMMAAIRKEHAIGDIKGETTAQRDWREIDVLYRSVLIPPNAQAGLFRALARIPGARVEKGIEDPLGRAAIGVTVTYAKATVSGWQGKQELFFDPRTYVFLGEVRHAAPVEIPQWAKDAQGPYASASPAPGTDPDAMITARAAWGVVDKPGERP
ncbi:MULTISPECIES: CU044_5270 family protein [unclassified Streptomyces]|uniref:CU044_5270 family protein n=1 Tax=unclassified Streptomyces TaxID=2593676 RepID=UPI00190D2182|nr:MULTISPECIES: CU044_5270 family protein [unclassified Streptomyces]MBK3571388.1 CU044_5270 family protein [Streptomyces sp. MBT62]MBK6018407.1 CU044_5270 family protein [Streptomyces sp. MBT53]